MATLASTSTLLALLGEPTRVRLLALLAAHELSVAELTAVTDLGQSRVSMHLGKLREAGIVRDRKDGASAFYALREDLADDAKKLWAFVRGQVDDAVLDGDARRCADLLRARASGGLDALAGRMERHYSPGRTWESLAHGLVGLVRLGDVLDIGSGDGTVSELLSPRARSVTCIDRSARMVEAAKKRLARVPRARAMLGDMHELPLSDASFDAVLLFNVLVHSDAPARAVTEAARVLRKGGDLVVVTLGAHKQEGVVKSYGHVRPGFSPAALEKLLSRAKLRVTRCEATSRERRPPHFPVVTAFATK